MRERQAVLRYAATSLERRPRWRFCPVLNEDKEGTLPEAGAEAGAIMMPQVRSREQSTSV